MTILKNTAEIKAHCQKLSAHPFVTVDTEFLREKTYYPKLCLIQISGPDKEAFAIDPLAEGVDLQPVYDLLCDPKILKVFHAGRQDMEIFFKLMGQVAAPFFDTQIAAMVCGYGDSIGYENIVRNITGASIDKSSQFTDWSIRPLSEKQIKYALGDVTHLCDVYLHLKEELHKRGRTDWVMQEEEILADPRTYANDPYESWKRIKLRSPKSKSLAILREIAAWREKQAQKRDVPKTWIMRDDVLGEIAVQAPSNKKQLAKIRNISTETAEGKIGDQILEAINFALSTPKDDWPKPERKEMLSPSAQASVDILKMLLRVESTENKVAAKLIASSEHIEALALDDNADIPAMKGWRYDIFGKDALAIKNGKLAIGLKDGKVTKFKTTEL